MTKREPRKRAKSKTHSEGYWIEEGSNWVRRLNRDWFVVHLDLLCIANNRIKSISSVKFQLELFLDVCISESMLSVTRVVGFHQIMPIAEVKTTQM